MIDPDGLGLDPPFKVYCDNDTDDGGWTMVFKMSSGIAGNPWELWNTAPLNEADENILNIQKSDKHYSNAMVSSGYWWKFDSVRVHVYLKSKLERFFKYSSGDGGLTSWHSQKNLTASSYVDMSDMPAFENPAGVHISQFRARSLQADDL